MAAFVSPFSDYLDTNYVPSSIDRLQILQLLKDPEAELAKLSEDISRLQAEIDDLQKRRDELDNAIEEHRKLLTPFRRLPDDMLREVFLFCLPEKHNALMSAAEAPLLLGRICSRWRSIAYHTPRLWATLHIPLPVPPAHGGLTLWIPSETFQQLCTDFEQRFKNHCQAVQDWLTRSGCCPLSISLNPRDSVPLTQNNYIRTYLEILLKFSHRWRSLEITIPSGEHSTFLASIPSGAVPVLEYLHLKFSRRSVHENVWANSGILNAKKLRVVHLAQFPYRLSTLESDWSRITHLVLSDVASISRNRKLTIDEAFRIFNRCKNLVHCVLDIIDSADAISPTSDVIQLPCLENLAIVDAALSLGTLFECLDVPSLRVVTYHTIFWPSSSRRSPLLTLLSRTNNHVEYLTTDIQFYTLADLVDVFELIPNLTHLTNKRSRFGVSREQARLRSGLPFTMKIMNAFLNLLLPDHDDRCLCPQLHFLDLKESHMLNDLDALTFIQQRIKASEFSDTRISRLTGVNITFTRDTILDIRPFLQVHIDAGLKLILSYPPPRRVLPGNFSPVNGLVKREVSSDIF
ncbi:hypothetical protein GALMADRAFT_128196 [Galerina marginata CBS 339.88]|uniref:Uncharacterized protein n=1 Tax=Galerina marginata (strain CBS 339.88) TaxID=685588 RepID=A0A067SJ56_GALM3|nr:hypothetical protein GALMADRAFT_128196 [Galerina marginata CBS 339.88]